MIRNSETALHEIILHETVLHETALHEIILHETVLHEIILYEKRIRPLDPIKLTRPGRTSCIFFCRNVF